MISYLYADYMYMICVTHVETTFEGSGIPRHRPSTAAAAETAFGGLELELELELELAIVIPDNAAAAQLQLLIPPGPQSSISR